MKALSVWFFLALGNFAYQYFYPVPDFAVALERTYFEGVALLTYYLMDRFVWRD